MLSGLLVPSIFMLRPLCYVIIYLQAEGARSCFQSCEWWIVFEGAHN